MATAKTGPGTPRDMLRIGATMGVPPVLRSLGLNPAEVLSAGGFDQGLFDDPDNPISFTARNRLLEHCAAMSKCEHFGLLIGQQGGLHSLGLVGLLARYSPDVGSALNNLVRYFHLHAHGATLSLEVQAGTAILSYQIQHGGAGTNKQVGDGAIAGLFNILRELCGPGWKPTEVWTMHREPQNIEAYQQWFKARLQFNAEQNAIVFHSSWLTNRLPEVHADVRHMVQKQVDSLAARHRDDFPEQVRAVLRAALLSGDAGAQRVAALFSIHPRTLNRRLNSYGVGYQALLDESRFEMARQMLKDSDLKIGEIALVLLYADARSFIQAFRRWSGETPARWRTTQKRLRRTSTT